MQKRKLTINNKLGLHARAAAKFVGIASGFKSEIMIRLGNREVNGKSIMGIMMLAAGIGTEIDIIAIGADENDAIGSLENLIINKFGEDE